MQLRSPACLQPFAEGRITFRKLGSIIITGMALAMAGCGGGGGGGGTPAPTGITGTESVLYSFAGSPTDGANPQGSLIQASDGSFYGMTSAGGANNLGSVFKITPAGTETVLYSFAGSPTDGASPYGSLIQASDGSFYGITSAGGANGLGSVFRITTNGTPAGTTETMLYSFAGSPTDGATPYGSLIQASDGNFYGMTSAGGVNSLGSVFRITTDGTPTGTTETMLYSFAGSGTGDGATPYGSLIQAKDLKLYGMTYAGGASGLGTVFNIDLTTIPTVTETVLYSFASGPGISPDGSHPFFGSLVQASDGNFYGMTFGSTAPSTFGTVFKITTDGMSAGTTTESVLHFFAGIATVDGASPYGSLIQASDGNLYGMTWGGGSGSGTMFKITTDGTTESVLHSFAGGTADGAAPFGSLIQASDGNLYGMTNAGGTTSVGMVIKIQ